MREEHHRALLDEFRGDPARLRAAVETVGTELMDFRPFADAWTIRENLAHLADAEVYVYARARKAIAEPWARVDAWDEEKWHDRLGYESRDSGASLQLFETLRLATAALLERLGPADWETCGIEHPERGPLTLEAMTRFYIGHMDFHLGLLERNRKLFESAAQGSAAEP